MKLSINIPFWFTTQDRLDNLRNVLPMWESLKTYLSGYDVVVNVFEFSPTKQYVENAIYIPTKGVFSKALKLNYLLKHLSVSPPDICMLVDCDCFVQTSHFINIKELLDGFNPLTFYAGNLTKLARKEYYKPDINEVDKTFFSYKNSGIICGLGGVSLVDFKTLFSIGGFDEGYTSWGLEDIDIGKRLLLKGLSFKNHNFPVFHLPHVELTERGVNFDTQYMLQKEYMEETMSIIRPSLLNNYNENN